MEFLKGLGTLQKGPRVDKAKTYALQGPLYRYFGVEVCVHIYIYIHTYYMGARSHVVEKGVGFGVF